MDTKGLGRTYDELLECIDDLDNEVELLANEVRNYAEQRNAILYLLRELGFDTTVLQGNPHDQLDFDDCVVVQVLKEQLTKRLEESKQQGILWTPTYCGH